VGLSVKTQSGTNSSGQGEGIWKGRLTSAGMTFVLFARRINSEKDGAISGNTVSLEVKKAAKRLPFFKVQ
jgi:hypothetical protein